MVEVETNSEEDSSVEREEPLQPYHNIKIRFSTKTPGNRYGYQEALINRLLSHRSFLVIGSLDESRNDNRLERITGILATVELRRFTITDEETLNACDAKDLQGTPLKAELNSLTNVVKYD